MKNYTQFMNEAERQYDTHFSPHLVSTRLPKGKGKVDPHKLTGRQKLTVGQTVMDNDPEEAGTRDKLAGKLKTQSKGATVTKKDKQTKQNVKTSIQIPTYPNIDHSLRHAETSHKLLNAAGEHIEKNLDWELGRANSIHELAQRSQQWYVGAHKIAGNFSAKFGVPHHVAAAVIATQSPQKDWYQNVSLAERILKIHHGHQNTAWSPEMTAKSSRVFKKTEPHQKLLNHIRGKSLGELKDPLHKAAWIRTYDEAHHPRHHRYITPEGDFGEHVVTKAKNKKRASTGWQSFSTIANAVKAIESKGDMHSVSKTLGGQHKVRSFYNNIAQPNAPKGEDHEEDHRDVTVDTHATGNAWGRYSLSGKSPEVRDALGGSPRSSRTGMAGTYPLIATAFRNVASKHKMIPNALQSVVWDSRRATDATHAQKAAIDTNWEKFRAGAMSHKEVLASSDHILGKQKRPSWEHAKTSAGISSTFESVARSILKVILEKNNQNKPLKRILPLR